MKAILNIPQTAKVCLVNINATQYIFIFGWLGFIKYIFKRYIRISIAYGMYKIHGRGAVYSTYLRLIMQFYNWTNNPQKKVLVIKGIGFKFRLHNNIMYIILGFSHIIKVIIPKSCKVILNSNKILEISSITVIAINKFIYSLEVLKKMNPYKLKGISLIGKIHLKKEGKKTRF